MTEVAVRVMTCAACGCKTDDRLCLRCEGEFGLRPEMGLGAMLKHMVTLSATLTQ